MKKWIVLIVLLAVGGAVLYQYVLREKSPQEKIMDALESGGETVGDKARELLK